MAVVSENPYGGFNFQVNLGEGESATGAAAGFSEVHGLGLSVGVIEYRNGNDPTNAPRKLSGLTKVNDIRLCRGLIGDLSLYSWLQASVTGAPSPRTVTIQLMTDGQPVYTWTLSDAIPVSYETPCLSAMENGVAIEELVIACRNMTVS